MHRLVYDASGVVPDARGWTAHVVLPWIAEPSTGSTSEGVDPDGVPDLPCPLDAAGVPWPFRGLRPWESMDAKGGAGHEGRGLPHPWGEEPLGRRRRVSALLGGVLSLTGSATAMSKR